MRRKYLTIAITAAGLWPAVFAAREAPPPKDVIKAREEGTVPTAVWLAECESLFRAFWTARQELDERVRAGGFANDPAGFAQTLNRETVPKAQAVADFCSAYIPDTEWGRQLRLEIIDAMVSSLAADARVTEVLGGTGESEVPLAVVLAEQKEMADTLIADIHERLAAAPKKYRQPLEKLASSRAYYFQDFHLRRPPGE